MDISLLVFSYGHIFASLQLWTYLCRVRLLEENAEMNMARLQDLQNVYEK